MKNQDSLKVFNLEHSKKLLTNIFKNSGYNLNVKWTYILYCIALYIYIIHIKCFNSLLTDLSYCRLMISRIWLCQDMERLVRSSISQILQRLCQCFVSLKQSDDQKSITSVPLCSQCCSNVAVLGPWSNMFFSRTRQALECATEKPRISRFHTVAADCDTEFR